MSIYADMEGHDAWLAERGDVEDNYDGTPVRLEPWTCPDCGNSVNGCETCLPPF